MAAPAQQGAPTADVVGNAFVLQYYHILEQSPEHVYRFYQDNSKFGRPIFKNCGEMETVTTMELINKKIVETGKLSASLVTVDAQESFNKGVFVLVTGFFLGCDLSKTKFTQSFFLAPQDKGGFYVLNDVLRYVGDPIVKNKDQGNLAISEAALTPEHDPSALQDNHVSDPVSAVSEGKVEEEVCNAPESGEVQIEEEDTPVPEVVNEIPIESEVVTESEKTVVEPEQPASVVANAGQSAPVVAEAGHFVPVVAETVRSAPVVSGTNPKTEEGPKKSYASIVKVMKESAQPFSASVHASVRTVAKPQEYRVIAAPTSTTVSETVVTGTNPKEDGNQLEAEAEGHSIYIKGLPINVTPALIEAEFKKFGPIKTGGIQVRAQKGFGFGFVEYEVASAVQSALEASPIMINGRQVVVEEKRSTSRGNRGRFSSARGGGYRNEGPNGFRNDGPSGGYRNDGPNGGYRNDGPNGGYRSDGPNGYRNDGPRGRGSGRGYGRGDFNSKSEFGGRNTGRGGSSSRGGEGYQRSENGGRGNRTGGPAVNAAAKTAGPRVSASA